MGLIRFIIRVAGIAVGLLVALVEVGFWVLGITKGILIRLFDFAIARRSMRGGKLHCPKGHEVPMEGQTWECDACGWTWEGEGWRCRNPECTAPVAPFTNCWCGLSVRSPYRWGRP